MEYISLKNGISVSRVGFGTGSSGFTGFNHQTRLAPAELARVLAYAYDEKGINFWDTGYSYGTYPHIYEAFKKIPRSKVVISTKFSDCFGESTEKKLAQTLKVLGTDHIDICLLQGARNSFEIKTRRGALKALLKARDKGYIRMLGLSAHGIGAIEAGLEKEDIEVLFSRINWSGSSMDSYQEGFLSKFLAVPYVKEFARKVIPKSMVPSLSAQIESMQSNAAEQDIIKGLLSKYDALKKPVIAMKVFGAGQLTGEIEKSIEFVMSLKYIRSFLLGMVSEKEVDENIEVYERLVKAYSAASPAASHPLLAPAK